MTSAILGVASGVIMSAIHSAEVTSLPWWQSLLIAIIPTIIGGIFDIVLNVLKNKGLLTKQDVEEIADKIEKDLNKDKEETKTEDKEDKEE